MNETRCIIKLRNQQPIFELRNFYYTDKHLMKRAWLPILTAKATETKLATDAVALAGEDLAPLPPSATTDPTLATPSVQFAARGATFTAYKLRGASVPNKVAGLARDTKDSQRCRDGNDRISTESKPDFQGAIEKSARRQADADGSIEKILTLFDTTPTKKRALKEVQKEVAAVFADK